jgi:hypothetical protein
MYKKKKPTAMASKTAKTTGPGARPMGNPMLSKARAAGAKPTGASRPAAVGKSRAAGGLKGVGMKKKKGAAVRKAR